MAKNPFSRIRAVSDADLQEALANHSQVLRGIVNWIGAHDGVLVVRQRGYLRRWKVWGSRLWAVGITLAVAWLAHKEELTDVWQAYTGF